MLVLLYDTTLLACCVGGTLSNIVNKELSLMAVDRSSFKRNVTSVRFNYNFRSVHRRSALHNTPVAARRGGGDVMLLPHVHQMRH